MSTKAESPCSAFLPPIVKEIFEAARNSAEVIRAGISNVKYGGIERNEERIIFSFRGEQYLGTLRGRNRDLCVGFGEAEDRAIACRVLLDGDAVVEPNAKVGDARLAITCAKRIQDR